MDPTSKVFIHNTKSRLLCIHSIENVVFYILKVVLDDNDDDNELDNNDRGDMEAKNNILGYVPKVVFHQLCFI